MVVGAAEGLKPGEVLDRRKNGHAGYSRGQWLVSPEKVTVAMDKDDRLSEGNRFLLQHRPNLGEAARVFFGRSCRRGMRGEDVRLLQNHDRTTVVGLRVFETLLQPGQVCLVAFFVFRIAVRRTAETVVAAGDVQRDEGHATGDPTDVLAIFLKNGLRALALANQAYGTPAEALLARKEGSEPPLFARGRDFKGCPQAYLYN